MKDLFELCAHACVDADTTELTPRQLFWVARAKVMEQWNHTSSMMALTFNLNTTGKKVDPSLYHPYKKTKKVIDNATTFSSVSELKRAMTQRRTLHKKG